MTDYTLPSPKTKTCAACGAELPATTEYFYRHKTSKDGLRAKCKTCYNAQCRDWDKNNTDKRREYARKRYWRNPERYRKQSSEWHHANPKRSAETRRRAYYQNREARLEYTRKYKVANREKYNEHERARRVRKRGGGGDYTATDTEAQYKRQRGRCYWCGKKVGNEFHADHVIPLNRGGSNGPENIVIACPHCNLSRKDKLPHEWEGGGGKLL